MRPRQWGFTLLEAMLSVGLLSIIAGISLPIYQSFQNRTDLDITAHGVVQAMRRAQVYSRGMKDDVQWGIEVQTSGVTLFRGSSFASRDTSYDEVTTIPNGMTVSGLSEVLFAKLSGAPNTTGSITLTSRNNEVRTITLNAKGMVNF